MKIIKEEVRYLISKEEMDLLMEAIRSTFHRELVNSGMDEDDVSRVYRIYDDYAEDISQIKQATFIQKKLPTEPGTQFVCLWTYHTKPWASVYLINDVGEYLEYDEDKNKFVPAFFRPWEPNSASPEITIELYYY